MVRLSPVGLAAAPVANQVSLLATFRENLCKEDWFCIDSSIQPDSFIQYTAGTPILRGTTVFVPITARVNLTIPKCGCNRAEPLLFTEQFYVAFQGRTALPTTAPVITSVGRVQNGSCVRCGVAHAYSINDSITVSIAAPAA